MKQTDVTSKLKEFEDVSKRISEFSEVIDAIENADEKKRHLWKEIYENAVFDRTSASCLFLDLMNKTMGQADEHHALNGPVLAKYLERMSKSNDQLLSLVEIITDDEQRSLDADDIFDKITQGKS